MPTFRTGPVRVRPPASSANLGPGFDALGLALEWRDQMELAVTTAGLEVEVRGEGAEAVPRDERHLLVRAARATFDALGGQPPGLRLRCLNRIPHARGLGSSSAAIVAGVLAARALADGGADMIDDAAALRLATAIEGHPDNVAACLLGGLTIAWTSEGVGRAVALTPLPGLRPVVFVPEDRAATAAARRLLPTQVPHADAAANAGRAALVVHALTADPSLLLVATEDRLHQQQREPAMPATLALVRRLRADGVAAVVSGAGPTVLALGTDGLPDAAQDGFVVHRPGIATAGASVEPVA